MRQIDLGGLVAKDLGYLAGLFIGDGYFSTDAGHHYRTCFCLNPRRDADIIERSVECLRKINLQPYLMLNNGCIEVRTNSKQFMAFMQKNIEYKKQSNKEYLMGLISGLIDSEGYVGNGEIVITNKDCALLKDIEAIIKKIGIHTKLWKQSIKGEGKWRFDIFRLRIGTKIRKLAHNSVKLARDANYHSDLLPVAQ